MRNLSRVFGIFFLLLFAFSAQAENSPLLIIEVQIAGEKTDNDFIKIYNPGNNTVDISGYKLRKRTSTGSESSVRVFPGGSQIQAKEYFLWANSKENFHLTIRADARSTATLAKNNSIALLNPENVILDALAWGESQNPFVKGLPFPENPVTNQQLKRKGINGDYQNTNNNSQDFHLHPPLEPPSPKTKTLPEEELHEESKPIIYPSGIIIHELLPSPEGLDAENEWIEISNQNNFEVELSGWRIEDTTGRTATYTFSQGTKIGPLGFLVLFRPTSKITLNNDADGLNLFQPDGKIIDSVSYEKAPRGQSYNRTPAGWGWSTILTPSLANIVSTQEIKEAEFFEEAEEDKEVGEIDINTASVKELQKLTGIGPVLAQRIIDARPFYSLDELTQVSGIGPKTLEGIKNQGLAWVDPELEPPKIEKTEPLETKVAAVAGPFKQGYLGKEIPKSLSLFLSALALAIFSGVIILILKNKLKKNYNKSI